MDEVDRQLDRDAPWDEAMIKKAREEAQIHMDVSAENGDFEAWKLARKRRDNA